MGYILLNFQSLSEKPNLVAIAADGLAAGFELHRPSAVRCTQLHKHSHQLSPSTWPSCHTYFANFGGYPRRRMWEVPSQEGGSWQDWAEGERDDRGEGPGVDRRERTRCFQQVVLPLLRERDVYDAEAKVIELDEESDGSAVQAALAKLTGQRTVPNVFIGGQHIEGSDDTKAMHSKGKSVPLLKDAGALKLVSM